MPNRNYLELSDLDTDPPANAEICPECRGYGILPTWAGFMQTSKDCDNCNCNGWTIPGEPRIEEVKNV